MIECLSEGSTSYRKRLKSQVFCARYALSNRAQSKTFQKYSGASTSFKREPASCTCTQMRTRNERCRSLKSSLLHQKKRDRGQLGRELRDHNFFLLLETLLATIKFKIMVSIQRHKMIIEQKQISILACQWKKRRTRQNCST